MAVVRDLIDEAYLDEVNGVIRAGRTFLVDELSGTPSGILYQSILHPEIPKPLDVHPDIPFCYVVARHPEMASASSARQCRIVVDYGPLEGPSSTAADENSPPIWEINSTTQFRDTDVDIFGEQLVLRHTYPVPSDFVGPPPEPVEQVAVVQVPVIVTTLSGRRRETRNPLQNALSFPGRVNGPSIAGYAPRTLLCTGIGAVTEDVGLTFLVSYEFQFNPDTWDAFIRLVDDQGHPPVGLVDGEGRQRRQVIHVANFGPLGVF